MKKILVTGGSGFIGSHVVDNLLNRGISAVILEHGRNGIYKKGVEVFLGDVRDEEAVLDAVGSCEGVVHLAGMLGTQETIEKAMDATEVNILGSLNILDACRLHDKRVVLISAGNYWMNNSYAITKSAAERFGIMYRKEFGTQVAIVRGFNIYGPRQRAEPVRKVVPTFVLGALKGEDLIVYGNGNQFMDMIYVEDVAEIIVRALLRNDGGSDTVIEAGMGRNTTINELAALVVRLSRSESRIRHVDMRPGEDPEAVVKADVDTLRTVGFSPERLTSLEEGLGKTVEWYRDHPSSMSA